MKVEVSVEHKLLKELPMTVSITATFEEWTALKTFLDDNPKWPNWNFRNCIETAVLKMKLQYTGVLDSTKESEISS